MSNTTTIYTTYQTDGSPVVAFAVTVMSVSSLFYIILGQWLFAKTLRLVPVSGFMDG